MISVEYGTATAFAAHKAILLYSTVSSRNRATFATEHEVQDGRLMPGRAINLAKLATMLHSRSKDPEFLHERAIATRHDLLVWWRKASPATMLFAKGGPKKVVLPKLLFAVRESRMYLWAVGGHGSARPKPTDKLYHPAIMNRYEKGDLCMGTMPKGHCPDTWEASFFNSRFTHPHFNPFKYRVHDLYAKGSTSVAKLVPCGLTVAEAIATL